MGGGEEKWVSLSRLGNPRQKPFSVVRGAGGVGVGGHNGGEEAGRHWLFVSYVCGCMRAVKAYVCMYRVKGRACWRGGMRTRMMSVKKKCGGPCALVCFSGGVCVCVDSQPTSPAQGGEGGRGRKQRRRSGESRAVLLRAAALLLLFCRRERRGAAGQRKPTEPGGGGKRGRGTTLRMARRKRREAGNNGRVWRGGRERKAGGRTGARNKPRSPCAKCGGVACSICLVEEGARGGLGTVLRHRAARMLAKRK